MHFIQYFLAKLILIPTALMCLAPMKNQMRYGVRKTLTVGLILLFLASVATAWLESAMQMGENDMLAPVLAFCFALYAASLRAPMSRIVGIFSVALSLQSILSNLSECAARLWGLAGGDERQQVLSSALFLLVGCVFTLPQVILFEKYGPGVVDERMPARVWSSIALLALCFFGINMTLRPVITSPDLDRAEILYLAGCCGIQLVTWSLLIITFYFIIRGLKVTAEERERSRLFEMQAYQVDSQQRFIKASERVRHDFRHSLHTLYGLYEAGEYDKLGQYLRQYAEELPIREIVTYTYNAPLNSLLNYFAHVSRVDQIDFSARVNLPGKLRISDTDLCSMVGNILENAVIACRRAEEKKIQLNILVEDGAQLYIVLTNTFDGFVRQKNGAYLSTNRNGGGIGLTSVAATAEKYGGVAQFSHEGKLFYSNIAIPLGEQNTEEPE